MVPPVSGQDSRNHDKRDGFKPSHPLTPCAKWIELAV